MSEENIGGEEGIIEERRKKLQLLRDKNKAYVNDFVKEHYAKSLHKDNDSFSKDELEEKEYYRYFCLWKGCSYEGNGKCKLCNSKRL